MVPPFHGSYFRCSTPFGLSHLRLTEPGWATLRRSASTRHWCGASQHSKLNKPRGGTKQGHLGLIPVPHVKLLLPLTSFTIPVPMQYRTPSQIIKVIIVWCVTTIEYL